MYMCVTDVPHTQNSALKYFSKKGDTIKKVSVQSSWRLLWRFGWAQRSQWKMTTDARVPVLFLPRSDKERWGPKWLWKRDCQQKLLSQRQRRSKRSKYSNSWSPTSPRPSHCPILSRESEARKARGVVVRNGVQQRIVMCGEWMGGGSRWCSETVPEQ